MEMFDKAFNLLFDNEKGYVNDKDDAGGETKFGISKARFPHIDIVKLTLEEAKELYRTEFWQIYRCGELPWPLAWAFFDAIANHNPVNPIKWLQLALDVPADGILGPRTIAASNACKTPLEAVVEFTLHRMDYVMTLNNYSKYKDGWRKRHIRTAMGSALWWHG